VAVTPRQKITTGVIDTIGKFTTVTGIIANLWIGVTTGVNEAIGQFDTGVGVTSGAS
jgi:hypothetical protein